MQFRMLLTQRSKFWTSNETAEPTWLVFRLYFSELRKSLLISHHLDSVTVLNRATTHIYKFSLDQL